MANKSLLNGSSALMVLGLISQKDMYGYQISEELKNITNAAVDIKAGVLYPILHTLENNGFVVSYEKAFNGKLRKYYSITPEGIEELAQQKKEWLDYTEKVCRVLSICDGMLNISGVTKNEGI